MGAPGQDGLGNLSRFSGAVEDAPGCVVGFAGSIESTQLLNLLLLCIPEKSSIGRWHASFSPSSHPDAGLGAGVAAGYPSEVASPSRLLCCR